MSEQNKLFTTNEAAEMLGVTPARVRQMVLRDEIEAVKMGRDNFITQEAIDRARQRKTQRGPAKGQRRKPENIAAQT